jgi:DNA polymerase-4
MNIRTDKGKERVIMLADCQSFYASIEKAAHPEYRDKPVVVAGDPARRSGIILAACPVAKQYGITTAERLGEAMAKCPGLIVIRPKMQNYIRASMQITEILESFTDLVEPYSIDEQFLDVTHTLHLFGGAERTARLIQEKVMRATGVRTRIGISYCKTVAKMACDNFAKKNDTGIFALPKELIPERLWPLTIDKLFMVGRRMTRHLLHMGVRTIGDLARMPVERLRDKWGINGEVLWNIANGIDSSPVSPDSHSKQESVGHQMTLPRDYGTAAELEIVLLELTELVCRRCREKGRMGSVVSVGCTGADFNRPSGFYRQMKLDDPTNITNHVYAAVRALFRRHWDGRPVRRVGVALSQLVSDKEYQLTLFDSAEKYRALERATDSIKNRFGEAAILRAVSLTSAGQARDRAAKIGGHYK